MKIKRRALVGLGLKDKAFQKRLNRLTSRTWLHVMDQVAGDLVEAGTGYIEVVREKADGAILGLHWLPAESVGVIVEDESGLLSYEINGGLLQGRNREGERVGVSRMAQFGKSGELLMKRPGSGFVTEDGRVSEVIALMQPSNLSRYYGVPDWLAVVATVELVNAVRQHVFDFFCNRGVPALIMLLSGGFIKDDMWKALTTELQSHVGQGNSHKTSVFHFPDEATKVTFQEMSSKNTDNGTFYRDMNEATSTVVMSAHSVPPALAGVQIPGKLGGTNELPNAIVAFQSLEAGPCQENQIEEPLNDTLGDPERNGGLEIPDGENPFEFRTLMEEMAEAMKLLAPAQTMAGAREQLPQQAAGGRDLSEGLKS